jgi:heme exporter protein A
MTVSAVAVEGVGKVFGRQRALSGVSFRLQPGRLAALVGPNGAGKSTLVGILSTLVRPTSGKVHYQPPAGAAELSAPQIRASIGLLAHESLVYSELDAVENLLFYASLYSIAEPAGRVAALLDEVGLEPAARRRPAKTYSRGMLQRLALARALLADPGLLLLDEPFTGLDRGGVAALHESLARTRRAGKIVLCVTHDFDAVADLCDHLLVLRGGKIVLDELREAPFSAAELRDRYAAQSS